MERLRDLTTAQAPEDGRIRLTSRLLAGSFALLVVAVVLGLIVMPDPLDAIVAALLAIVVVSAALQARALASREGRRRADAESVARLLRGLARSVSADAIVGAIAGELAPVVDADHVVVIRLRGDPPRLEATLVSTRPGIPSATTKLPLSDLEDPVEEPSPLRAVPRPVPVVAGAEVPAAVGSGHGPAGGGVLGLRSGRGSEPSHAAGHPARRIPGVGDAARAQRIADRLGERAASVYGLRHTISAPLVVEGEVTGALVLSRRTPTPWTEPGRVRLQEAATEASVALARARTYQAAEARASTDALTGLPNRRYFDEFCGLLARRRRSGDAIGALMIDIDRFKQLNDRHGHAAGDEVLRAVGQALVATVRDDDVPARYGGEEFVVLLRNPTPAVAAEIGERARRAVSALDLTEHGVGRVTVSVGVAVQRSPDQPVADVVAAADAALYRAKRAGRDRVIAG